MAVLNSIKWCAIITALLLLGGLVWEHIAKKNESTFKPSTGLWKLVPPAEAMWHLCGEVWARISSFLISIKDLLYNIWIRIKNFFSGFWETITDFFTPILKFCFSWTYFFEGYFETAKGYAYPALIVVGSLILLFIFYCNVAYILAKYEYIDASYSPIYWFWVWWYGIKQDVVRVIDNAIHAPQNTDRAARTTKHTKDQKIDK